MALALHLDNLWKSYAAGVVGCSARVWALRGCALELEVGECLGIVGAAGSGKTTLIHCIAGTRRPDAGRIAILHPVTFFDGEGAVPTFGAAATSIVTSRDLAGIRDYVDRVLLLRDGHLTPISRSILRRVAEPVR
jgi:ABC-type multidrug transport system ATPase subunit